MPSIMGFFQIFSTGKTGKGLLASVDVVLSAAQSSRGRTLMRKGALSSASSCASSASLGCRGKEAVVDLHVLTAQVRKLMLRTFILVAIADFERELFG